VKILSFKSSNKKKKKKKTEKSSLLSIEPGSPAPQAGSQAGIIPLGHKADAT